MSDDQIGLKAVLDFQSFGGDATLKEVEAIERALNEFENAGESTRKQLEALGISASEAKNQFALVRKEIDAARAAVSGANGGLDEHAKAWQAVTDSIKKAGVEFERYKQLDAMTDPRNAGAFEGDNTNVKDLTDERLAAQLRYYDTLRANRESDVRAEAKSRAEKVAQAQREAEEKIAIAKREAELNEEFIRRSAASNAKNVAREREQAAAAAHAVHEIKVKQWEQTQADAAKEIALREEMASKMAKAQRDAAARVAAQEARDAEAQQKARLERYREEEALKKEAAQIRERLSKRDDDQDFERSIAGYDDQTKAVKRLERATEELAAARRQESAASDPQEQVAALKRVEAATRDVDRAQQAVNTSVTGTTTSIESMRYAMYDVGRQSLLIAGTIAGTGLAITKSFADWQSGMSSVAQTTDLRGGALAQLEDQLMDLASAIPITVSEIQELAAQAGQLGVDTQDIEGFVEAMAQFGVISDSVSASEAGEVIAKLGNILGDTNYQAIAAAIAQVGVESAATDAQIIEVAREMGRFGQLAGMTSEEVIGLSATFASLMIPAEQARSVMIQFANVINGSIGGDGSGHLENMARIMDITAEEAANLWKTDAAGFLELFTSKAGDAAAAGGDLASILDSVGLVGQRALPVFATLSERSDLLTTLLGDASKGYNTMQQFEDRYAQFMDDIASMWQLFVNDLEMTGATLGETLGPLLVDALSGLSWALQEIRAFSESDLGQGIITFTAAWGGLIAALTATAGVISISMGGFLALQLVIPQLLLQFPRLAGVIGLTSAQMRALGITSQQAGINAAVAGAQATAGMNNTALATARAAAAMGVLRAAFKAFLIATGAGIILAFVTAPQEAVAATFDLVSVAMTSMASLANGILMGVTDVSIGIARGVISVAQVAANAIAALRGVKPPSILGAFDVQAAQFRQTLSTLVPFTVGLQQQMLNNFEAGVLNMMSGGVREKLQADIEEIFGSPDVSSMEDAAEALGDYADAADGAGDSTKGLANEVRTLVDYANDLSSIWDRAFEIRFSGRKTMDEIKSSYYQLAERFESARQKARDLLIEIDELNAAILKTQSSIQQQEYFLSVAIDYGDDLRADDIRAELAKLQADLAKQQSDLAKKNGDLAAAQDEQSTALTGSSKAAIENRKTMTDLVSQYQAHIKALAASGLSQEELAKATALLKADFMQQATQLGYNQEELRLYAAAFDDVAIAIATVPRNITVTANTHPALQALNEFLSRARSQIAGAGLSAPVGISGASDAGANAAAAMRWAFTQEIKRNPITLRGHIDNGGGKWAYTSSRLAFFQQGGYTGRGAADEPAGIVHRGEYVVPKHMVDQRTGLPNADAMGRLYRGSGGSSYQSGGYVGGGNGIMVVELSAADRRALANKAPVVVQIGPDQVARAANAANFNSNKRGDG